MQDGWLTIHEALAAMSEGDPGPPVPSYKSPIDLLAGGMTYVDSNFRPVPDGMNELLEALSVGDWCARGMRSPLSPTSKAETIPAHLWDALTIGPDNGQASGGGLEYSGLRFQEGTPRRRGRKPGDGKFVDKKHLAEMKQLIDDCEAKSTWDAAGQVAAGPGVKGASLPSKQKRLSLKYKLEFG